MAEPPGPAADLPLPEAGAQMLRGDPDTALYVMSILEAVEWKWTPAQVLEQPEALLEDVLTLAGWAGGLRRKREKPDG